MTFIEHIKTTLTPISSDQPAARIEDYQRDPFESRVHMAYR